MYHLYTEIKGTLLNHSYISLIDELHPTPALGGYPKKEAVDYIEKNEFGIPRIIWVSSWIYRCR